MWRRSPFLVDVEKYALTFRDNIFDNSSIIVDIHAELKVLQMSVQHNDIVCLRNSKCICPLCCTPNCGPSVQEIVSF